MAAVLVVVAMLVAFFGFASLSQATMGVGFIGGGCLLAILARIVQASEHQSQLRALLAKPAAQPPHPTMPEDAAVRSL